MASATTPRYQDALIDLALRDRIFRSELKANPAAAIRQATGLALPLGLSVEVLEETPDKLYIVLPPLALEDDAVEVNIGLEEVAGLGQVNTHFGCGNCSVTAPQTSKPCGCR